MSFIYCLQICVVDNSISLGPVKLNSSSIQLIRSPQKSQNQLCHFRLDDWISFIADAKEAQLILKTRHNFYQMYDNYLQYCGCLETHNKRHHQILTVTQNSKLCDCIEKILTQEDQCNGLIQPERIGLRPKALPNQFIMNHSAYTLLTKSCYKISNQRNTYLANKQLIKQFFIIYNADVCDKVNNMNKEWYHQLTSMLPLKNTAENKLTFVISYSLKPDLLHGIALAEWDKGILKLHYCFKCEINLLDIL